MEVEKIKDKSASAFAKAAVDKDDKNWWQPGLYMFFQLSGLIAGPIILAVFLGKWLDKKYNSDPWLFIGSVTVAFIFSNIIIIKTAVKYSKEEDKKKK